MELVEAWFRQRVKILLLTLDQAGPGWSMCHFLVAPPQHGMNLMLDFENDFFHRSPNDFNWARDQAEGGHRLTAIQMIHVFNANFGPYLTGARMLQKQEFLAVIRQWKPIPDDEVCQHARDMAAGAIPATQEDMDHLYEEQILNNLNFVSQGPFCRMKGWYTFVACMARYDPQWHAWKQLLRWLGQFVSQQGGKAGHALREHVNTELSRLVSEAPQNDDGPPGQRSADAMKEGIAKLKNIGPSCHYEPGVNAQSQFVQHAGVHATMRRHYQNRCSLPPSSLLGFAMRRISALQQTGCTSNMAIRVARGAASSPRAVYKLLLPKRLPTHLCLSLSL